MWRERYFVVRTDLNRRTRRLVMKIRTARITLIERLNSYREKTHAHTIKNDDISKSKRFEKTHSLVCYCDNRV